VKAACKRTVACDVFRWRPVAREAGSFPVLKMESKAAWTLSSCAFHNVRHGSISPKNRQERIYKSRCCDEGFHPFFTTHSIITRLQYQYEPGRPFVLTSRPVTRHALPSSLISLVQISLAVTPYPHTSLVLCSPTTDAFKPLYQLKLTHHVTTRPDNCYGQLPLGQNDDPQSKVSRKDMNGWHCV
jgi:hypothetical protein